MKAIYLIAGTVLEGRNRRSPGLVIEEINEKLSKYGLVTNLTVDSRNSRKFSEFKGLPTVRRELSDKVGMKRYVMVPMNVGREPSDYSEIVPVGAIMTVKPFSDELYNLIEEGKTPNIEKEELTEEMDNIYEEASLDFEEDIITVPVIKTFSEEDWGYMKKYLSRVGKVMN